MVCLVRINVKFKRLYRQQLYLQILLHFQTYLKVFKLKVYPINIYTMYIQNISYAYLLIYVVCINHARVQFSCKLLDY